MINNIQKNVILAPYTTYRIGGKADYFFIAKTKQALIKVLEWAKDESVPYVIIGGGSNLLISDAGFRGLVILNRLNQYSITDTSVTVESGMILSALARKTVDLGLSGFDFAVNIPGTVGGAVVGNAGAYGTETSNSFVSALVWSAKDGQNKYEKDDMKFSYRSSALKNCHETVLIEAEFRMQRGDRELMLEKAVSDLEKRKHDYRGYSCGSYFKNPTDKKIKINKETIDNPSAGYLIDSLGLKGLFVGGARVSKNHANVIVNENKASAKDIIDLEKLIIKKVKKRYDVEIQPEVTKIGIF
ncbi:MAG: UDP-N-acetylmuramate dehydrogenase [bacterium]